MTDVTFGPGEIDAVCFDFYYTLVELRDGRGRGSRLAEYFETEGLTSGPWRHDVLYHVFEPHAREYSPSMPAAAKAAYLQRLTGRLFDQLDVDVSPESMPAHAERIWELVGPASLVVFPDVLPVVRSLRGAGLKTAIVSNWMCGLGHFCTELGLADGFDHVLASAELGVKKPEPEIFVEACRRLGTAPGRTLHVGDTVIDDLEGGRNAGLHALLIERRPDGTDPAGPIVRSLDAIPRLLGLDGAVSPGPGGP
ncbi:MAG: HAD family hydrolase [Gemmatimonadota bacterium]|jgi:HAD superfamily hydrolase (TIGR01509 family)